MGIVLFCLCEGVQGLMPSCEMQFTVQKVKKIPIFIDALHQNYTKIKYPSVHNKQITIKSMVVFAERTKDEILVLEKGVDHIMLKY